MRRRCCLGRDLLGRLGFFFAVAGRTHFLTVNEQGPVFWALSAGDCSEHPACPGVPHGPVWRCLAPGSLTSARLTGEHLSPDPHQGPSAGRAPAGSPPAHPATAAHLLCLPVS